MDWSSRPFVRIFFVYVSGILMAFHLSEHIKIWCDYYLLILFFQFSAVVFLLWRITNWRYSTFIGICMSTLLLSLAYTSTIYQLSRGDTTYPDQKCFYSARVLTQPVAAEKTLKTVLAIRQLNDTDLITGREAKVLAFLQGKERIGKLHIGDRMIFKGRVTKTGPPLNPNEFDYGNFLKLKGIYHTVYLSQQDWKILDSQLNWSVNKAANQIRNHFLEILKERGLDGDEYAVTAAIILGYDEFMETGLRQDFVNAGAMHILCVSGLHVGVIYLVVNFLLSFLNRRKFKRIIKVILLLLVVWSYAFITGLSPSVQRASVMISLFILGNNIGRSRDSYNTLAASAVILLVSDPLLLFNVGFQLSYAAVFGILALHRPLYSLIYFKNKFIDKTWSVFVLSIAAQLGTFPLATHYFHFFPTYFWISNLFIFPLSFMIISCGFIFLVISWIPVLSGLLGQLLSFLVFLLNYIVGLVELLPYHGIDKLFVPWTKVVLFYLVIIGCVSLFFNKKIQYLKVVLVSLLAIHGYDVFRNYHIHQQQRIAVYSINNHTAIDFIDGKESYYLMDSVLAANDKKQNYHLSGARINWGVRQAVHLTADLDSISGGSIIAQDNFYLFGGKRILVLDGSVNYFPMITRKVKIDVIIVTGNRRIDLQELASCFDYELLVMDASVPFWKRKKILEQSEEMGLRIHDVREKGAFIMELRGF